MLVRANYEVIDDGMLKLEIIYDGLLKLHM